MIKITLPDGQIKTYLTPITIQEVAISIGPSLAKRVFGGLFNNKIRGLDYVIDRDGSLELVTDRSPKALEIINYTTGLIVGRALTNLYPQVIIAQVGLLEEGFYLDFVVNPHVKEDDLDKITNEVTKLINANISIKRTCANISDAKELYQNNPYVLEMLRNVSKDHKCSYFLGENLAIYNTFLAGNAKQIKVFKLTGLTGAYWENSAKNKMLQRITGIGHFDRDLFTRLMSEFEERKERDHRRLGKELEIFTFDKLIGPGLPIWLPNGMALKRVIQDYIRDKEWEYDFIEVDTPVIGTSEMYQISGHWTHYRENMFAPMEQDHEISVLRPMACPHHIAIYNHKPRSYRDLPFRIAEHAILHRYESSGSLTGLERVRMMQLTDSHIFVRSDQIKAEFKRCFQLINEVLTTFKIKVDYYSLSLRDPNNKEKYYDDDVMWNNGEKMLQEALDDLGVSYVPMVGEAAFYGPKLDIQIKTALNHEITVSTLQFDFLLPQKFNLSYIDSEGKKVAPTMIHRGLIGTYERFIAILLEQSKGILPLWLAPKQVVIIPVANEQHSVYSAEIKQRLKELRLRTFIDDRDERLSYKIRSAQTTKIPYQLVLGDSERDNKTITYRRYGSAEQFTIGFDEFVILINQEVVNRE